MTGNGWDEWKNLVLQDMERSRDHLLSLQKSINMIRTDIAKLKVQSSVWGLLGGGAIVALSLVVQFLKG